MNKMMAIIVLHSIFFVILSSLAITDAPILLTNIDLVSPSTELVSHKVLFLEQLYQLTRYYSKYFNINYFTVICVFKMLIQ
jgi:hypothetical protein